MVKIILSDRDLKIAIHQGRIKVTPLEEGLIDSCSLGLRLGYEIRVFQKSFSDPLNPFEEETVTELVKPEGGRFVLKPGEFVLGSSLEYISLPKDLAAHLMIRSSLSRLGIILIGTAGIIQPGFEGNLTFALGNISQNSIVLYPEMYFCKLVFETLSSEAMVPYYQQKEAKYQKQKGPVPSRLYLEKSYFCFGKK